MVTDCRRYFTATTLIAIAALSGCDEPSAVPDSITISPASASLASIDDAARFTATVFDQYGEEMPDEPLTWTSPDPAVATVDAQGIVTAKGNGTVAVRVSAGSAAATAAVTVSQAAAKVAVSPAADTVLLRDTTRLEAVVADANGHVIENAVLEWVAGDTSVAEVDDAGLVTGLGEGTTTVTAKSEGVEGTGEITVFHPDREVLVALYRATNGPGWSRNSNWLTDRPLDEWYGVSIHVAGWVYALYLNSNSLTGEIPSELGDLSRLRRLYLYSNSLTGEIPPELGDLSNLTSLDLYSNSLTGEIPLDFLDLSSLGQFYWDGNDGLCAPDTTEFDDWLDRLNWTGPRCD